MAHDLILGTTRRDWSLGSLPKGATGYVPKNWWTEAQAEAEVQKHMKGSGFLSPGLPRKDAEETVMDYMRANKIGVMSGIGSLLIPDKQQKAFLSKIDDIRYDVRRVGAKIGGATLVLSAALGLLGVASLYKTVKSESGQPRREPYRWDKPRR
jgi:hypothetical protein